MPRVGAAALSAVAPARSKAEPAPTRSSAPSRATNADSWAWASWATLGGGATLDPACSVEAASRAKLACSLSSTHLAKAYTASTTIEATATPLSLLGSRRQRGIVVLKVQAP